MILPSWFITGNTGYWQGRNIMNYQPSYFFIMRWTSFRWLSQSCLEQRFRVKQLSFLQWTLRNDRRFHLAPSVVQDTYWKALQKGWILLFDLLWATCMLLLIYPHAKDICYEVLTVFFVMQALVGLFWIDRLFEDLLWPVIGISSLLFNYISKVPSSLNSVFISICIRAC